VRLAGDSEFALAFFSLTFGVLLVAMTYHVAHRMLGRQVALWSAFLITISPFHIWYSQEVRMYTLAALLGLLTWWCAWKALQGETRAIWCYALLAAIGLYVLYYFVFLLVIINFIVLLRALFAQNRARNLTRTWMFAQLLVLALYAPWLPVACRQAIDPPVPPWRGFVPWHMALLETWTALSFGQSVQLDQVWPLLLVTGGIFALGIMVRPGVGWRGQLMMHAQQTKIWLFHSSENSSEEANRGLSRPGLWLAVVALGPVVLINLGSLLTPLYHVRYAFTYSPPFYIILGAGLAWLMKRKRLAGIVGVLALLSGTSFSLWQLHTHPAYAADDLRGAVQYIAARWRPGDAILINAGYAYPAFLYYYRGPLAGRMRLNDYRPVNTFQYPLILQTGIIGGSASLGWGDSTADFYSTTEADTAAALARVLQDFPRIWVLRVYDTVADGEGFVRRWLVDHTIPFEDQDFIGPSYVRVQGFISQMQPLPPPSRSVQMEGDIALRGWDCPREVHAGSFLDAVLWWEVTGTLPSHSPPYAVSLKLWDEKNGVLVAQQDEWPLGSLLFTPAWPQGRVMRHPMRLYLPAWLSSGSYKLDVQVYNSATVLPFERVDGAGNAVTLSRVTVAAASPDQQP